MSGHKNQLYNTWYQMLLRCENPKNHNFKHYGGRGIKVCERWKSLENFTSDMGPRPPGTTLDRINCNGDYEPKNCRWADQKTQHTNTRSAKKIVIDGESFTIHEAARQFGVDFRLISARINRLGWDAKRAATTPSKKVAPYQHWTQAR